MTPQRRRKGEAGRRGDVLPRWRRESEETVSLGRLPVSAALCPARGPRDLGSRGPAWPGASEVERVSGGGEELSWEGQRSRWPELQPVPWELAGVRAGRRAGQGGPGGLAGAVTRRLPGWPRAGEGCVRLWGVAGPLTALVWSGVPAPLALALR